MGTNVLVGSNKGKLKAEVSRILKGERRPGTIPPLWDGHASDRIAEILFAAAGQGSFQQQSCSS
jgi:UDP-N-acetylglucosamine 2-epimerase (non-hydrolysing)